MSGKPFSADIRTMPLFRLMPRIAVACCLLTALPPVVFAHPHVWITAGASFIWDESKLAGVYVDWEFDPYFSADIIRGYDANGDGRFDAAETRNVFDNAFASLKEYGYFLSIRQGRIRNSPAAIDEFSVRREGAAITYRFFVDLSGYRGDIAVAIYDPTYFCAIEYGGDHPVRCVYDRTLFDVTIAVAENRDDPVYYDPRSPPGDLTSYRSWREGLSLHYPKELRLRYESIGK